MGNDKINMEHVDRILETIETNPVYSFSDIFVYFKGCSRATAYNHNLDKLDVIKEAIEDNKRVGATTLLAGWIKSTNATLQIAAFRMICTPEERQKLNQQYIDHTTKGESIKMTPEERDAEIERLKNKLLNDNR